MNRNKNLDALIITGPTAVGKTDLALEIAATVDGEVINADVGQFYQPLSIGTAKPDWRNMPCSHHLFDILTTPENFTVVEFRDRVQRLITNIKDRNKMPIIVGGSQFYLKSLFFSPSSADLKSSISLQEFDEKIKQLENSESGLWGHLDALDPSRAACIEQHDTYRVIRALELWYRYGLQPSACIPCFEPMGDFHIIYVDRVKDDLLQRIEKRTRQMLEGGWIDEVKALKGSAWETFLIEKGLIGYPEIFKFLKTEQTCEDWQDLHERIVIATRQYAKRQATFWRSFKRALDDGQTNTSGQLYEELNLTLSSHDLYIRQPMLTRTCLMFKGDGKNL